MSRDSEPVEVIFLREVATTAMAKLFALDEHRQKWIPRSVILDEEEGDGSVTLQLKAWWAEKEGLV